MRFMHWLVTHGVYLTSTAIVFCVGYIFVLMAFNVSHASSREALYLSVGTSLIAAGIVAILDLWRETIRNTSISRVKRVLLDAGILDIYRKRDLDRYDDMLAKVRHRLDVTGYSLNAFLDSYGTLISGKLREDRGLRVRLLVVDPESAIGLNRAALEGHSAPAFIGSVKRLEVQFARLKGIEIRRLGSPLTSMIFRIDDAMFVGPHFHRRASKSTLTMELQEAGWLFREYEEEFDRLWKDGVSSQSSQ